MPPAYDRAFLKRRARAVRQQAQATRSESDWDSAALILQRTMSDMSQGFVKCPLRACRRARRCSGNMPICMTWCEIELVPGGEQECIEENYADIQAERRDAEAEQRAPVIERAIKDRVHVDDEETEDQLAEDSAEDKLDDELDDELEENMPMLMDAPPRREDAPLQPPSPLPKSQPPVAAPPVATAAEDPVAPLGPRSPRPWQPNTSPEVEQRIDQIWADYVAGKPMPRPLPRIRLL